MKALLGLFCFVFSAKAVANNQFIPNHYKNRRTVNQYSAIGWSDRKEVGLLVNHETSKETTSNNTDNKTRTTAFIPRAFYRVDENLNLEFMASRENTSTEFTQNSIQSDTDSTSLVLNAGYELKDQPVAFGVGIGRSESEVAYQGGAVSNSTFDSKSLAAGAGYRLDSQVYIGFGYTYAEAAFTTSDLYLSSYNFGLGKVYGDRDNPTGIVEAVFSYDHIQSGFESYGLNLQGLLNSGPLQYFGEIEYSDNQSSLDTKISDVSFGVDYGFGDYFVSPLLTYRWVDYEDKSKNKRINGSFQVGYRVRHFETYLIVHFMNEKDEGNVTPFANSEEDSQQFTLAAIYKF